LDNFKQKGISNYIPINQFISGTFNLTYKNESKKTEKVYFYIQNEEKENENNTIIEFGKNYEGLKLNIDGVDFETENKNGFVKYIIKENENKNISLQLELNKENKSNKLLNANYMLRYYYDNDKFNNNEFLLNKNYKIKNHEIIQNNKVRILFEFEFEIKNISNKIGYKIYCNIYEDKNINEILNTSAITLSTPLNLTLVSVNNDYNNFSFNITFNIPNPDNYKYIMQIKVDVDNKDYYQKIGIASYSIPIDLTNILKKDQIPENKGNNNNIIIILIISILIIIIIVIIFMIVYFIQKRKNQDLEEKVLSISFAQGETGDVLNNNDLEYSKKDEEYETKFI